MGNFRDALARGEFVVTGEIAPPHGPFSSPLGHVVTGQMPAVLSSTQSPHI